MNDRPRPGETGPPATFAASMNLRSFGAYLRNLAGKMLQVSVKSPGRMLNHNDAALRRGSWAPATVPDQVRALHKLAAQRVGL